MDFGTCYPKYHGSVTDYDTLRVKLKCNARSSEYVGLSSYNSGLTITSFY